MLPGSKCNKISVELWIHEKFIFHHEEHEGHEVCGTNSKKLAPSHSVINRVSLRTLRTEKFSFRLTQT
jgi:hypothetical protein